MKYIKTVSVLFFTGLFIQGCTSKTNVDNNNNDINANVVIDAALSQDGITVSAPANGAGVATSFNLTASASSCSGQAIASMGYSLDNSSSTTTFNAASINTTVSAATGAHTLHVKSWGKSGAGCSAALSITVAAANPITVSSPAAGNVSSPFSLKASASSCSGQAIASMGYSLDNSSSTTTFNAASISTSVSAATGAHTLHVKSWGKSGSSCSVAVNINVSAPAAPPTPTPAPASGFTVSSPASGSKVNSPFSVKASSATCSSKAVVSMGYSLDDSSSTTTANGTSISGSMSASTGAHVLHIKSWNSSGAGCSTSVNITVGTAAPTPTPTPSGDIYSQGIPSNAIAAYDLDTGGTGHFTVHANPPSGCHDPGTAGSITACSYTTVDNFDGKAKAEKWRDHG